MGGQLKGAGFNSLVAVLREAVTEPQFTAFVASLPSELREHVQHPPMALSWLPYEVAGKLYPLALEHLLGSDYDRIADVGRRQFVRDMSTLYRMFVRIATPHAVATRAHKIYEAYCQDLGVMTTTHGEHDKLVYVDVKGHPEPTDAFWHYLRGAISGVVELTRTEGLAVRIQNVSLIRPECRFAVSWTG